ncbi:MAG: hypothetical protein OXP66_08605 [Candidatus Tectomicrobia bacterium]|nr:hypothetical protein [Candidatus Tectomicrobia bacterium]
MNLLPFLDIIFGTIGIFVVVFAFQSLVEVKEGIPPGVDSIVTCVDGENLTGYWPDGSTGVVARPERSFDMLQALAEDGRHFRSMILALSGDCYKARLDFLAGFGRYLEASAMTTTSEGRQPAGLMLELYPIGDEADAKALLNDWRGDPR